ncbi:MAG: RNA polymerase sigma factor [Symbiobacteriia bacterium]
MTDEELVDRCLRGDTAAFTLLVDRYRAPVYRLVARMLSDSTDAEDAAQETFIQVYRGLPAYRGQACFSTWVYRIAVNRCLDQRRRRQNPTRQAMPLADPGGETGGVEARLTSPDPGPEDWLVQRETQQRVRRALADLPEHYRAVVVLYHFEGLSYRDVSEVLGLPIRTIETRLYRAKNLLKSALTEKVEGGAPDALHRSSNAALTLPQ